MIYRATWAVLVVGAGLVVACSDDRCDTSIGSSEGKIGPGLSQQLADSEGGTIAVAILASEEGAVSCLIDDIEDNGGRVNDVIGSEQRIIEADLTALEIETIAKRGDIESISSQEDDTPPG